jgi:hypothetical protein
MTEAEMFQAVAPFWPYDIADIKVAEVFSPALVPYVEPPVLVFYTGDLGDDA